MFQYVYFQLFVCAIFSTASSNIQSNDLTRGLSEFSKDFYWECARAKSGNVIISPLSVGSLLALLSQGADGSSLKEITNALHLTIDKATIANQTFEHSESIHRRIGDAKLSIANRIYVQHGQRFKSSFKDVAVTKFKSDIELLNFSEAERSAQTINSFVERSTNGKIRDLVNADKLSSDTRSILINAIYFKGNWEIPFMKHRTSPETFHINEKEKVTIKFMNHQGYFNYANVTEIGAEVLEMKYANSNLAFLIVLPNSLTGLPALERTLKNYNIENIIQKMRTGVSIDVTIPKFKIEYGLDLNDVLRNLGINEIFTSNAGLSEILESDEGLRVSDVVHKAFIEINEEGSEAAAATAGGLEVRCCIPTFTADHPFMFFIRDTQTNTIVFSGRIVNFS